MNFGDVLTQALPLTFLFATPFLLAALGEVFVQRSGVLNLGVEGMMLMGAFCAIYVVAPKGLNQSPLLGLLAAALVGGVMGLAMAFVSVTLQAEQGISGIGFTLFGLGVVESAVQAAVERRADSARCWSATTQYPDFE